MHEALPRQLRQHERFGTLYAANFIFSFHVFFVIYIQSSFLETFINERFIGVVWILGALFGIAALLLAPLALRQVGNFKLIIAISFVEMLAFLGLAFTQEAYLALSFFVLSLSTYPLIIFALDIFLESYTKEETATGGIRGIFLTTTNVALIIAPLFAGLILTDSDYWKVYLISAFLLIPFIALLFRFRSFKDPIYRAPKLSESIRGILSNKNIYGVCMMQFILRLSYAAMVIYLPIYLHRYIGFTWTEFGIIAVIMLLPFALFELPAGRLADSRLGEKEMLSSGFIIAGIFTAAIPFITSAHILVWAGLLFLTRTGSSLVEIMTESYFFKHVRGEDDDVIEFFRILNPLAYVIGPLGATAILLVFDIQFIFLFLALTLFYGLRYALFIEDTR